MNLLSFHTLPRAISNWASVQRDAPAAIALDQPDITWGDLDRIVRRVAATLRAAGIGPGDPVALLMPPSRDALVLTLAVAAAAPAAPLDHLAPAAELAAAAALIRPRLVLAASGLAERAAALGCPVIDVYPGPVLAVDSDDPPDATPHPRPEQIAMLLLTAGLTGEPRLVPRQHRQLVGAAMPFARALGLGPRDRWLVPGFTLQDPALTGAVATLMTGGTIVSPASAEPAAARAAILALRPTWTSAPPHRYRHLIDTMTADRPDYPFRVLVISGAAPDPTLAADLLSVFGAPAAIDYGPPEAPHTAFASVDDVQPGLLWPLIPGAVAILGEDGQPVPAGQPGDIVTTGPHRFAGYIGHDGIDPSSLTPDGWFRTGDRGVIDESGALHLSGRSTSLINRGGTLIDPAEVEAALRSHPGVAAAGIYSVPDELLGEDLRAAVVLRPGAAVNNRELRRWMLDRLTVTKVPRSITMLDDIPTTPDGQVDRTALAATIAAAEAAAAARISVEAQAAETEAVKAALAALAERRAAAEKMQAAAAPAPVAASVPAPASAPAPAPTPANPPVAAAAVPDAPVQGPVRLVGGMPSFGHDRPLAERLAITVSPSLPIREIVLRGHCDDPQCNGRLILVSAGDTEDSFLLRPVGAFKLAIPVDLPANQPATITFSTTAPAGNRKKGGKGKKKNKRKNSQESAPPLGFAIASILFEPR
jgi:acyl-CoA synthetase (AMP-forming)/AMP-acid ligase II